MTMTMPTPEKSRPAGHGQMILASDITKSFGDVAVLHGVSLGVERGETAWWSSTATRWATGARGSGSSN